LIIANIAVFMKEVGLAGAGLLEPVIAQFGLVPKVFLAAPAEHLQNIFTHMFMHGSWGHVLSNMWFLYIFGDNVEDKLGHFRYLVFYILMGIGAATAQVYMNQTSLLPMVGASGAIAGVLGAYFILFPRAHVLTFFVFIIFVKLIEVPAFFYLGFWFLIQTVNGFGSLTDSAVRGNMGGVAWWAHAGGFASGILLVNFFRRSR
jgi:membrane associated rhomboid family serine protease